MRKINHYWGFIRIHSIICGYVARKNVKTKIECRDGGLNLSNSFEKPTGVFILFPRNTYHNYDYSQTGSYKAYTG